MPTSPGHSPLQLRTVRIGPSRSSRPGSTWWLYCQTASATTTGASRGISRNTSSPIFWLSMNPCPLAGSKGWARFTLTPSRAHAAVNFSSSAAWAAWQVTLAESRRSPLAAR